MNNDFKADLAFSHTAEDSDIWPMIYAKAFHKYAAMTSTRDDGQMQRLGVDRTIITRSGKAVYIDEKVRRKWYGDILLEYIANDNKMSEGWVEKPLFCDYIAYAVPIKRKCFILPVQQLQAAWIMNKDDWLNKYGTRQADNKHYKTLNCPVPIDILFKQIGAMLRVTY